jgi:formate hydrogenlyase subunit 6/NADH:ubiquinone oxidoreductase subunit I
MDGAAAARKRSRPDTANGTAAGGKRSKGEASYPPPPPPPSVPPRFFGFWMLFGNAACEVCDWICPADVLLVSVGLMGLLFRENYARVYWPFGYERVMRCAL